jgi:hypothetical protein
LLLESFEELELESDEPDPESDFFDESDDDSALPSEAAPVCFLP